MRAGEDAVIRELHMKNPGIQTVSHRAEPIRARVHWVRYHAQGARLLCMVALTAVLTACGGGDGGGGQPPPLTGMVTTIAGTPGQAGSSDGSIAQARFNAPQGVAVTDAGVVYVADTGNHTIRRIGADGVVSTLAGTAGASGAVDGTGAAARFTSPAHLVLGPDGSLYASDTGTVRKITQAGVVTTVQQVNSLLAIDANGNLYSYGPDASVMRTTPAGATSTVVAKPPVDSQMQQGFYFAFAIDAQGNFYTAERVVSPTGSLPKFGLVRRFNAQGVETATASVVFPTGLVVDNAGRPYAACGGAVSNQFPSGTTTGCSAVLAFDGTFAASTLAGVDQALRSPPGYTEGTGSADGPGATARFKFPAALAVSAAGIYVADTGNHTVRRIQP